MGNVKTAILRQLLWVVSLMTIAMSTYADPNWQLNMYKGVTPISRDLYHLHMIALWICIFIGIAVFGVMIYALIYHRKSKGHKAAHFHENTKLELLWSFIPFLILIGLAIPATNVLIRMDNTDHADVTIKVVGYQWKWEYQYLDQGIRFYSSLATPYNQIRNIEPKNPWYLLEVDNPVIIPVNKKVRFLVTANDVIHSWWVPELGIKRDAIPGFMHEAWARADKEGTYRGQCTELCGINHAYMPIVVKVVSQEAFDAWVKQAPKVNNPYASRSTTKDSQEKPLASKEMMALGKMKYEQICSACHKADGTGMPPVYPALKGSSVAVGHPIDRHVGLVLNGVPGTAMQAYKDQLTDEEIAAIVTYERNAWDNNTGEIIKSSDVARVRVQDDKAPTMVNKAKAGGIQ